MRSKTVKLVVESDLCTGCGTCTALCPENAIKMMVDNKRGTYIPILDEIKCNSCGICYKVCPGHEVDYDKISCDVFGNKSENIFIGNSLNSYVGFSEDINIRTNSSSGGLISHILISALEEKIISGALVTRMRKDKPLEAEPFIARTKEEIIEASQSKYCPVPTNTALKYILESSKDEKFAVVGLPCHINGIRKAEKYNNNLRDKIILHVGIFCNHIPNLWATQILLQRHNIKKEDLIQLKYRGNGWPGFMEINSSKQKKMIPQSESWGIIGSHFFYPKRCLMCSDGTCELADLSCGDAWLKEFISDDKGTSVCISKNIFTENLLKMMISRNELNLTKIDLDKVIKSQSVMLYLKKKNASSMRKICKRFPKTNNIIESNIIDHILALYIYFNLYMSLNIAIRSLLANIPIKLIHIYRIPYSVMLSTMSKKYFEKSSKK